MVICRANPALDICPFWKQPSSQTFQELFQQLYSLMIQREYVTLFLVCSCFLLGCQIPRQAQLQSRNKSGAMSAMGGTRSTTIRAHLMEVTPLERKARLRRHGKSRIQRIKRGWVWNQFFVLEEYMGSDPQYVGKVSNHCSYKTHKCV